MKKAELNSILNRYGKSRHHWQKLHCMTAAKEWLRPKIQDVAILTLRLDFLEETWEKIKANEGTFCPAKHYRHTISQDIRAIEHDRARKLGRIWQVQDRVGIPRLEDGRGEKS